MNKSESSPSCMAKLRDIDNRRVHAEALRMVALFIEESNQFDSFIYSKYIESSSIIHHSANNHGYFVDALQLARAEIENRKNKIRCFPSIISSNPSWDILLDLLEARLTGKILSIKGACISSGVPMTTALRYLDILVCEGYVERSLDPNDGRRVLVSLTSQGCSKMAKFLQTMIRPFGSGIIDRSQ